MIANELEKYYKYLFQRKPSSGAERMLKLLGQNKISPKRAKLIAAPFTAKNATSAIRRLAKGKSPGPDKLPAEYRHAQHDLPTDVQVSRLVWRQYLGLCLYTQIPWFASIHEGFGRLCLCF